MTIQEAIKSGKPFRRPCHIDDGIERRLFIIPNGIVFVEEGCTDVGLASKEDVKFKLYPTYFTAESLIAVDWCIKK